MIVPTQVCANILLRTMENRNFIPGQFGQGKARCGTAQLVLRWIALDYLLAKRDERFYSSMNPCGSCTQSS